MPAQRTRKPVIPKSKSAIQETKLALIYGRVSSKKQVVAGDGLNSQLTACLKVPHQRAGDILRNPAYAGLVGSECWGIPFRKGHHEPLISVATHQRIQDRLNGKERLPSRKNLSDDFPLRTFVMCDDCGEALTACWSKGTHARHPYYLCPRKPCASYGKSIRRDVIEGEFEALLRTAEPDPRLFALATAMFKELWTRRAANGQMRKKALKEELARVERQIDDTVQRIVEISVPAALRALEEKIGRLEKEKLLIAEKIATATMPQGAYDQRLRTARLPRKSLETLDFGADRRPPRGPETYLCRPSALQTRRGI